MSASADSLNMWQLAVIVIQAAIALAGFLGALMINRLIKAVDSLTIADGEIHTRITAYREDMLRNYVRIEQLSSVKQDIIGRVDRFELSITKMFNDHRQQERDTIESLKDLMQAHLRS